MMMNNITEICWTLCYIYDVYESYRVFPLNKVLLIFTKSVNSNKLK